MHVLSHGSFGNSLGPVRPGALVRRLGDLIIVNQSVKVLLKFDNISTVRENIGHINQGIQMVKDQLDKCNISNVRMEKKLDTKQLKVNKVENNFLHSKSKRGLGLAITIGSLVGLAVTNIGFYADIRSSVNNLQNSMSRIDTLTEEVEEIQLTIDDLITNTQHLSVEISNVKESLDIFMLLDQLHIKINELDTEMEQLIQNLVLANAGHVTLLLLNITEKAKWDERKRYKLTGDNSRTP